MSWFQRLNPMRIRTQSTKKQVPEGVWTKCNACDAVLYQQELEANLNVCPKCNKHMRLTARTRLESFLDEINDQELGKKLSSVDFLHFKDNKRYKERLTSTQKSTGESDALIVMEGTLLGQPLVAAAMDFSFMGASMGSVVGERFRIGADRALEKQIPFVIFVTSGGARMQEGLTSLMQMAKTSALVGKLNDAGIPFISVLTDPTFGGVSASFAMLGDIILAEPGALIGFAGPRVIEQTVREQLPEGFQQSEFLLEKGAIDRIVDRRDLRNEIASLLAKLTHAPVSIKETS